MKRTKQETIDLFHVYEDEYLKKSSEQSKKGEHQRAQILLAKADAYAMAAFELEHNME